MTRKTFIYSTYNYGVLDTFDGGSNKLTKEVDYGTTLGEWVFVYMGFNWKTRKAYGYVRFMRGVDSVQFENANHYVPNQFYIYIGNDRIVPSFWGTMQNWKLYFGDGAYTTKPDDLIESWPYDPTL